MRHKLKDIHLKSVDFCGQGANPDAYIRLYKSEDGPDDGQAAHKTTLLRAWELFKTAFAPMESSLQKTSDAQTFDGVARNDEQGRKLYQYTDMLQRSFESILHDYSLQENEKRTLMMQSLDEFSQAMQDLITQILPDNAVQDPVPVQTAITMTKTPNLEDPQKGGNKGVKKMDLLEKYNLKDLTTEELTALRDGIAKSIEKHVEPTQDPVQMPPAEPSSETIPEPMQKAINYCNDLSRKLEDVLERQERAELLKTAQKYEALGEKPEELAERLYDVKKAGSKVYDTCIAALDRALDAVKKSDEVLFSEIGKSNHQFDAASGAVAKAQEIAKGLMGSGLTYQQAMAKAWEQNPDLAAEYQKEYEGGMA